MAASVPWALNIQRAVTHSTNAVEQLHRELHVAQSSLRKDDGEVRTSIEL